MAGPVEAAGALPALDHEAGLPQDLQMLGNRRPGDREVLRDPPGRKFRGRDEMQDRPAGRVGDGPQDHVEFLVRGLSAHLIGAHAGLSAARARR
ncbi:hypothetical protein Hesp01_75140 [Herbidospora sp. NBRC 101105]|nr:hypothetical protein Hesp01_75140 [Herbidospora sp. NBRC 101105]